MINVEKIEKHRGYLKKNFMFKGEKPYKELTDIFYIVRDTETNEVDVFSNIKEEKLLEKVFDSFLAMKLTIDKYVIDIQYKSSTKTYMITKEKKEGYWPFKKKVEYKKEVPYKTIVITIPSDYKIGLLEKYFDYKSPGVLELKDQFLPYISKIKFLEMGNLEAYIFCLNILNWPDIDKWAKLLF